MLLAIVAPLAAGDEAKKEDGKNGEAKETPSVLRIDPKIDVPEANSAKKLENAYGVVVNVDDSGNLAVGDRRCSLESLQKALVAERARVRRANAEAPEMRVLLRVSRNAPWVHVQWILLVCAEEKFGRTEFAVRRADGSAGFLKAWLPEDRGLRADPRVRAWIKVHAIAREERESVFRDGKVMKPTATVFTVGTAKFDKLADIGKAIRLEHERVADDGDVVRCEIKAGHKVPFGVVAALIDRFHDRGIDEVDFYGTALPDAKLRKAATLPYPETNYVTK